MRISAAKQKYLRQLPAIDKLLEHEKLQEAFRSGSREITVEAAQQVIAAKREQILMCPSEESLQGIDISPTTLVQEILDTIENRNVLGLKRVLNATGVLLHTNLGRAPLPKAALEAVNAAGVGFSNLELSLGTGKRSTRYQHVEKLICHLTGAEAALVVNNNAGAVFLALNSLASGTEVVVSRGELVEIGGSFRIPEVMTRSGCQLREVGTTNKCYLEDYRNVINENTALLLKVHTSNFKIMGFTATVEVHKLSRLGREYDIPLMEDLGSGMLVDLTSYGLPYEPRVQDSLKGGADLVTFSGDKLLGGPQAGIIAGRRKYIEEIKKNQLLRALRVDKMTLSALEATLRLYLDQEKALKEVPVLRMLTISEEKLLTRARDLHTRLQKNLQGYFGVEISREKARVGGGSMPLVSLPSCQVSLKPVSLSGEAVAERLRTAKSPVLCRIRKGQVLLDLRSIQEDEDELLAETVVEVLETVVPPEKEKEKEQ